MISKTKPKSWSLMDKITSAHFGTFSINGSNPNGKQRMCLDAGTDISYLNCQQPPLNAHAYCNPNIGAEERAKDLVSRLELPEKAMNLNNQNPS
mgnify:CR=1 FL=1